MNKPKFVNPDRKNFFRTITFKAWLSFLSLAVLIIGIMSAVFVLTYSFTYRQRQLEKTVNAGIYLIDKFPSSLSSDMTEFEEYVNEYSVVDNMTVIVFKCDEVQENTDFRNADIIFSKVDFKDEENLEKIQDITERYFSTLVSSSENPFFFDVENKKYDGYDVVIGASKNLEKEKVYFFVQAFMKNTDFATSFFSQLFIGMSLIALSVSIFYALLVGKRITEPLVTLSNQVRIKGKNPNYQITTDGYDIEEIEELARSLEFSSNEQIKAEEFRRDLVANVSHDLRTPLTMIKAYAEMIRDLSGNNAQKREQHCDIIINEVDTLNALVGDLLELSKLQAGTVEFEIKSVSLDYIVKTVLSRLNIFVERDGYEFITDIEENLLCSCDSKQIEQAVYNLICNAINYTGKDKKVYISLKREKDKIRFSVTDTGKGIKKEEIDRIWDRYYRANQTKRSVAGSGIGLSIVQNILLRHNMEFGVDSEVGKGSTFYFIANESKD